MKKQLLTIFAALSVVAVVAQPSASLNINQNAIFPSPAAVTNPGIKFLDAVDANVVWTIGYDAAAPRRNYNWYSRSINGGALFAGGNVYADTNTYQMANMEGVDANTAWVSAFMKSTQNGGAIHRTNNGGSTWTNMTAAGMFTASTAFADIVSFFTPSVGVTIGDPVNSEFEIWRTTDGGLSWNAIPGSSIANPLSAGEYGIVDLYYRLGTNNLWFGTNQGRMYHSSDAGLTWSAAPVSSSSSTLIEIAFSSANNGVCTVINGSTWELWNTTNGGSTWSQINTISPNFGYNDMSGVPGTNMLVSVDNQGQLVSSSSDNGVTWNDWGSLGIGYVAVDFVGPNVGWAGAYSFGSYTNMWKYSGATLTGTTAPTAGFSIPANLCLTGNSATVSPVNTSTGSPAPTYVWSVLPAATISNPTATTPIFTFNNANTYTVTLVATNAGGSNTVTQVVTVAACIAPTASFSVPASACTNFTFAAVNSSTGAPAPSSFWTISPATNVTITPSAIASNPVFKVSAANAYTITLVSTNANGTVSSTQVVNVSACPPTASFSIPARIAFCEVKSFSTTNQTTNPAGTSGAINYTWTVAPNTSITVFPNLFQQNLSITLGDPTIASYTVTLRARNASGTASVSQVITIDDCTGISENALSKALGLYPNPVRDQLTISVPSTSDSYSVKITNLLGSVVYSDVITKEKSNINLANTARGVYFITIESKDEKVTRKIILD